MQHVLLSCYVTGYNNIKHSIDLQCFSHLFVMRIIIRVHDDYDGKMIDHGNGITCISDVDHC